jgi:hypothetical protein
MGILGASMVDTGEYPADLHQAELPRAVGMSFAVNAYAS